MDKPLVIYHGNCADGFGAAWVFWKYHPEVECDFHPGVYQDPPPDVKGRSVYLLDFSYKRAVVEQMLSDGAVVTLIDHHKTAVEDLQPLIKTGQIESYTDMEKSGAILAWEYLVSGEAPQLLRHIEDRDLWRFALPYTREIQAAVFSHPYDFKLWDGLMMMPIRDLVRDGEAIERKHFKDIRELLPVVMSRMTIAGFNIPVANLPYIYSSDAGHMMAESEPFAACYWDTPGGKVFSLRSREGGIDVSEIAKIFGGGGHKHAAGFKIPHSQFREMMPYPEEK